MRCRRDVGVYSKQLACGGPQMQDESALCGSARGAIRSTSVHSVGELIGETVCEIEATNRSQHLFQEMIMYTMQT